MDFQTILPSTFVALHDAEGELSQAVLECISRIWILAERPLQSVYHFDIIYGGNNSKPTSTNSHECQLICLQKRSNI